MPAGMTVPINVILNARQAAAQAAALDKQVRAIGTGGATAKVITVKLALDSSAVTSQAARLARTASPGTGALGASQRQQMQASWRMMQRLETTARQQFGSAFSGGANKSELMMRAHTVDALSRMNQGVRESGGRTALARQIKSERAEARAPAPLGERMMAGANKVGAALVSSGKFAWRVFTQDGRRAFMRLSGWGMAAFRGIAGFGMGAARAIGGAFRRIHSAIMMPYRGLLGMVRHITQIRHLFWNLAFLGGMIAGGVYGAVKLLSPAAKEQTWERQFGLLLGDKDKSGVDRMQSGAGAAEERIDWLSRLSTKLKFTMTQTVEAGRLMQVFGIFSKRSFITASDAASAYGKDIDQVVRSLGYLSTGRYGAAARMLMRMGISQKGLEGEGVKFSKGGRLQSDVKTTLAAVLRIWDKTVGGMSQAMADTFEVSIVTMGDAFFRMRAKMFRGMLPFATTMANTLRDAMEQVGSMAGGWDWEGIGSSIAAGFNGTIQFLLVRNKAEILGKYASGIAGIDPASERGQEAQASVWSAMALIGKTMAKDFGFALWGTFSKFLEELPSVFNQATYEMAQYFGAGINAFGVFAAQLPEAFGAQMRMSIDSLLVALSNIPGFGGLRANVANKVADSVKEADPQYYKRVRRTAIEGMGLPEGWTDLLMLDDVGLATGIAGGKARQNGESETNVSAAMYGIRGAYAKVDAEADRLMKSKVTGRLMNGSMPTAWTEAAYGKGAKYTPFGSWDPKDRDPDWKKIGKPFADLGAKYGASVEPVGDYYKLWQQRSTLSKISQSNPRAAAKMQKRIIALMSEEGGNMPAAEAYGSAIDSYRTGHLNKAKDLASRFGALPPEAQAIIKQLVGASKLGTREERIVEANTAYGAYLRDVERQKAEGRRLGVGEGVDEAEAMRKAMLFITTVGKGTGPTRLDPALEQATKESLDRAGIKLDGLLGALDGNTKAIAANTPSLSGISNAFETLAGQFGTLLLEFQETGELA